MISLRQARVLRCRRRRVAFASANRLNSTVATNSTAGPATATGPHLFGGPYRKKTLGEPPKSFRRLSKGETEYVHVTCPEGIGNMAEAFAIMRAVERKWGRVQYFRFVWDYEDQTQYQNYFFLKFKNPSSLEQIPYGSVTVNVAMPVIDRSRQGGIGLDDLRDSLMMPISDADMAKWGSALDDALQASQRKTVLRMRRQFIATRDPLTEPRQPLSREMKLAAGHAFLDWGGFAADRTSSAPEEETRDHPTMREAVGKWSQLTGRPDPNAPPLPAKVQPVQPEVKVDVDAGDIGSEAVFKEVNPSSVFDNNDASDSSKVQTPPQKSKPPLLTRPEMKLLAATMGRRARAMPLPQADSTPSRIASRTGTGSAAQPRRPATSHGESHGAAQSPPAQAEEDKVRAGLADKIKNLIGGFW